MKTFREEASFGIELAAFGVRMRLGFYDNWMPITPAHFRLYRAPWFRRRGFLLRFGVTAVSVMLPPR